MDEVTPPIAVLSSLSLSLSHTLSLEDQKCRVFLACKKPPKSFSPFVVPFTRDSEMVLEAAEGE